eukprot:jgi/Psemu1/49072/gm1.49072_g
MKIFLSACSIASLLLVDLRGSSFVSGQTTEELVDRNETTLDDEELLEVDDMLDIPGNLTMFDNEEEEDEARPVAAAAAAAAAAATATAAEPATTVVVEPIDHLDRYEVVSVGGDLVHPAANINRLEPFTGEVYFEAQKERFDEAEQGLFVEMFARVPEGLPCSYGYLVTGITDSSEIVTGIEPYDDYSKDYEPAGTYPRARNGRIGKATFSVTPNAFDMGERQRIFFPRNVSLPESMDQMKFSFVSKSVSLRFCPVSIFRTNPRTNSAVALLTTGIRVSTKVDFTGDGNLDTVGFVETHFVLSVELVAEFASFETAQIMVKESGGNTFQSAVSKMIPVESFLCDENKQKHEDDKTYRAVCVVPKDNLVASESKKRRRLQRHGRDLLGEYSVVEFENIRCSNIGQFRQLVNNGAPDVFTEVDAAADALGGLSFKSVVTTDFFKENESRFKCDGDAILEYNNGRRVRTRILQQQQQQQQQQRRRQQSSDDDEDGLGGFDFEVKLDTVNGPMLSSSALFSPAWMVSIGMALTAIMFV